MPRLYRPFDTLRAGKLRIGCWPLRTALVGDPIVPIARHPVLVTSLLIWLLFSTGAYALAQLSAVAAPPSADATTGISGYTVANISYALRDSLPSEIASVRFTLHPSFANTRITTVRAKLVSSSASYSMCANVPAGSQGWVCPVSGVPVAAADQLMLDVGGPSASTGFLLRLPLMLR
jgi:hypothetical protein